MITDLIFSRIIFRDFRGFWHFPRKITRVKYQKKNLENENGRDKVDINDISYFFMCFYV